MSGLQTVGRSAADVHRGGDGAARFLDAKSVVVIGASAGEGKVGSRPHQILDKLGFAGEVFLVNPHGTPIDGRPAYRDLTELPVVPDLAVVCLSAERATEAVKRCAAAGVPAAVVFSNGFAESGNTELQAELSAVTGETLRLLGPNCLGFADFVSGAAGTFSSYLLQREVRQGAVALVTQSGALGNSMMLAFESLQVDVRAWVATGNEVDLTITDFLEALVEDEHTRLIVACVESLKDGSRWTDIARRAQVLGKRILVVKGGMSQRSRSLALSHSGKMLGSHTLWTELVREAGIVSVESMVDLADAAHAADCLERNDFVTDRRQLGVVTSSGGLGVLLSDACERAGIVLADLESRTHDALVAALPAGASVQNPVDPTPVTDDAYFEAARLLLDDENVGVVLVILQSLSRHYPTLAPRLVALSEIAAAAGKTVAISYLAESDPLPPETEKELRRRGVIALPSPDRVVRALGHVLGLQELDQSDDERAAATAPEALTWREFAPWLDASGLPVVDWATLSSPDEAAAFVTELRGPAVFKIDESSVGHKSDIGGVILDINDAEGATAAYRRLTELVDAEQVGVVAQQQVGDGLEIIVSVRRDNELGDFISVGWGGTHADLIADLVSAPCPLTPDGARRLFRRSRVGGLLAGFRGDAGYDEDAFAQLLVDLSRIFMAQDDHHEMEFNPVRVFRRGEGCVIVDALVPRS